MGWGYFEPSEGGDSELVVGVGGVCARVFCCIFSSDGQRGHIGLIDISNKRKKNEHVPQEVWKLFPLF